MRYLALGFAFALAVAGCSGSSTVSSSPKPGEVVTLTWWMWPTNDKTLPLLFDDMKKEIPGVDIKVVVMPGDQLVQKLKASLVARSGAPDITLIEISGIAEFRELKGSFVDLNSYVDKLEPGLSGKFFEAPWQGGRADDGRQVALPKEIGPGALFYRPDLLKAAGLPIEPAAVATLLPDWDSFIDVAAPALAKAANGKKQWLFGAASDIVDVRLAQLGWASVVDGEPNILSAEVRDAVTLAKKFRDGGYTSELPWGDSLFAAYASGQIAFLENASFFTSILKNAADPKGAGKWRMTTPAGGAFGRGGDYYAVTEQSEHKELAAKVIHWFATNQKKFCASWTSDLSPGAYKDNFEGAPCTKEPVPYLGGQVVNEILTESAAKMKAQPLDPQSGKVRSALTTATDKIFRGASVEETLAEAQKTAERDVKAGR